jgi:hypothetical protein
MIKVYRVKHVPTGRVGDTGRSGLHFFGIDLDDVRDLGPPVVGQDWGPVRRIGDYEIWRRS